MRARRKNRYSPRRLRGYIATGIHSAKPLTPAQEQEAHGFRQQLVDDHLQGDPSAGQQVILGLLASAITKHRNVWAYLVTKHQDRPWVDAETGRVWGLLHDLARMERHVAKLLQALTDPALERKPRPVEDLTSYMARKDAEQASGDAPPASAPAEPGPVPPADAAEAPEWLVTLLDAITDDALLGTAFAGPSWRPWYTFLRAVDALPLAGDDLELYRQCTGRQRPPTTPAREVVAIVGRRGGKSRLAAALAVEAACFKDWTPHLAVGERATIALIAADRAQSRIVMEYVRGLLTSTPLLAQRIERETDTSIELEGHVAIEVTTCSARTTRGYSFCLVIGDEAAFWKSETSSEPDVEVLQAVRPGLSTLPGARLICISSPYSRRGVLWQAFKGHHGQEDDPVLVWVAASDVMNPSLDPGVIAAAYEADPASAAAEYGACFRTDVAGFVTREVVDACVIAKRQGIPPLHGTPYVAFCDASGGLHDSMTLGIAHPEDQGGTVVGVLDHLTERTAPFSPDDVTREFAAILRAYGITQVGGDRYAGSWPAERFAAHGIAYVPSERAKSEIYMEFLPLLTSGRVKLLDCVRLVNQLLGLERKTARGGRDTVDHGPHGADDVVNSAAGALVLAAQYGLGDGDVLATNVRAEPRGRVLDDREMAWMRRA